MPQRVDLRLFALTGDGVRVPTVGLTRVAPPGGLIVNSSRGGGAKDAWLLGPSGEDPAASAVDVRGRDRVRAGG